MTGPADIRISGRPGVFEADQAEVTGEWLHAEGRWRRRVGGNHADHSYGQQMAYSWPSRSVEEVRWGAEA